MIVSRAGSGVARLPDPTGPARPAGPHHITHGEDSHQRSWPPTHQCLLRRISRHPGSSEAGMSSPPPSGTPQPGAALRSGDRARDSLDHPDGHRSQILAIRQRLHALEPELRRLGHHAWFTAITTHESLRLRPHELAELNASGPYAAGEPESARQNNSRTAQLLATLHSCGTHRVPTDSGSCDRSDDRELGTPRPSTPHRNRQPPQRRPRPTRLAAVRFRWLRQERNEIRRCALFRAGSRSRA